jgi:hypothetical protein
VVGPRQPSPPHSDTSIRGSKNGLWSAFRGCFAPHNAPARFRQTKEPMASFLAPKRSPQDQKQTLNLCIPLMAKWMSWSDHDGLCPLRFPLCAYPQAPRNRNRDRRLKFAVGGNRIPKIGYRISSRATEDPQRSALPACRLPLAALPSMSWSDHDGTAGHEHGTGPKQWFRLRPGIRISSWKGFQGLTHSGEDCCVAGKQIRQMDELTLRSILVFLRK